MLRSYFLQIWSWDVFSFKAYP